MIIASQSGARPGSKACGRARHWAAAALLLTTAAFLSPPRATPQDGPREEGFPVSRQAADSAIVKWERLQQTAAAGDAATAQFTQEEANSFLHYELSSHYPAGLSLTRVRFLPGRIFGIAEVDFDQLQSARRASGEGGMVGYLFRGRHTLSAEGSFSAVNGVGQFDPETVWLDGVALPRVLVEFLIENYLRPRYPGLALDSPFRLPAPVDRVQVMRESIEIAAKARVAE